MERFESRVRLEVDLGKLRQNYARIAERAAGCRVMPVLKANAYGLGVLPVARALISCGATRFGVAELNEALTLRELGVEVQILGNLLPAELSAAVAAGVIVPVADYAMAEKLAAEGRKQGKQVRGHVIVDTGMGRLGIREADARQTIPAIARLEGLTLEGIYTHFPTAYVAHDAASDDQVVRFKRLIEELKTQHGITFAWIHAAASDALNHYAATLQPPFNLVRPGINLYGYYDNGIERTMALEPIVALKTRIAEVRELPAGATLGYGRTYELLEPRRIATIAAGYADGLPLALSNRGFVLIRGALCPIVGRLSMDYTTVDVTQLPEAAWGDEVVCFGTQNGKTIPLSNWAQLKGTHAYELLCSIGSRVARVCLE